MKKIRFYMALWLAKLSKLPLILTKHNASNLPGVIALKICPDTLKYIEKPEKIIAVTGTNGKTTIINLIIDILKKNNTETVNNKLGSNTITGITTALIEGCDIFGKCKYEYGVLEVDERSSIKVYSDVIPDYLVITNLFRDSIMRNAHPEYIANILSSSIPKKTKLILNADDLISCNVARNNERKYFAIAKMDNDVTECSNLIDDLQLCPICHSKLKYDYLRYHHIGKAHCDNCGFSSPLTDYTGEEVDMENMSFSVKDVSSVGKYKLLNDSIFNIYNLIAVISLFREMGYAHNELNKLLVDIKIIDSRYHTQSIGDITVTTQMAKDRNALACSRVFDYIKHTSGDKEIVLMMNNLHDAKRWSENICWLYDCDFEFLKDPSIKNIVVTGPRAKDYLVRLLMAGVDKSIIKCSPKEIDAPNYLKYYNRENVYILFGTDSISLAKRVSQKTLNKIKGKFTYALS